MVLRAATEMAHRAIERQPLLRRVLSSGLTAHDYVSVLQALWAWYSAIEPALERFADPRARQPSGLTGSSLMLEAGRTVTPPSPYRFISRKEVLQRDLACFGKSSEGVVARWHGISNGREARPEHADHADPVGVTSAPIPIPDADTVERILGILYVVEGATQGGRIIAPRVEHRLGLEAGRGTGYFRLYLERKWPAFRALAHVLLKDEGIAEAAAAAQQTFHSLHQHLDGWRHVGHP